MKKRVISVLLVLSMLMGIMLTHTSFAEDEGEMSFVDVNKDDWFYPYVKAVFEAGAMKGKSATTFEPKTSMTRAEVVTVLCRLSGDDYENIDDSYSARFSDVVMDEWYVDYINWAVKSELVLGYNDGTFKPDANIKRQEIAVLFTKFFDYIDLPVEGKALVEKFADEDSFEGWAVEYIEALRKTGLVGGDDNGNFNPENNTLRAEMATILTRLLPRLEDETPETTEPETSEPETTEPDITFTDPTPDNIGILYENVSNGLKISELIEIDDTLTTPGTTIEVNPTASGIHGWHETRVVRTEYGTYVTYISDNKADNKEYPRGNTYSWDKFSVIKITADGCKVIYEDWFPHAEGSCTPNILRGSDGMIYVTIIADDKDAYLGSYVDGVGFTREAAWLNVYEINTKTDTCTYENEIIIDYDVIGVSGYGYSQPVLDPVNGKIYAFTNGGMIPGYISWFIYDLETHTWDPECYTVQVPWRVLYYNAYADGNGGVFFTANRGPTADSLGELLGVDFRVQTYIGDALYLVRIPDVTREQYEITTIYEPTYSTEDTGVRHETTVAYQSGGTLLTSDGKLHVVYSNELSNKVTIYHVIYDTLDNFKVLKHEPLVLQSKVNARNNKYMVGLAENTNGEIFLLATNYASGTTTVSLEIWRSTNGGVKFTKICNAQELSGTDSAGNKVTLPTGNNIAFSLTNRRNYSILDNVIGIVTYATGADGVDDYYYYSVELPH